VKANPLSHLSVFFVSASGFIAAANAVLALLVSVVLARLLGVTGFGVYSLVYVILMMASTVLQAGLPRLVTRETARALAREDWAAMGRIWRWSLLVILLFSVGSIALAVIAITLFSSRFDPEFVSTLLVGLVLLPLLVLSGFASAILQGLGYVIRGQIPGRILRSAGLIVMAGATVAFGWHVSPHQAMSLTTGSTLIAALVAGVWLWQRLPYEVRGRSFTRSGDPTWWRSMFLLAASVGLLQLNSYTDILIVGMFLPSEDVGIYRAAAQTATFAMLGLHAVRQLVTPSFVRFHAAGETAALQRTARRGARIAFSFSALVAIGGFFLGSSFLDLAFGDEFRRAETVLTVLLVGGMMNAYFGPIGVLLNMTGHEDLMFLSTAAAAIANAILCFAMVPSMGILGGAVSTLISVTLWNALAWFAAWRTLGVDSRAL